MREVVWVDLDRREVRFRLPETEKEGLLGYHQLVLDPGDVTRMPDVPGLAEFGYEMKCLTDAVRMLDRAIQQLERAPPSSVPK